jgi:uncharacterized protein YndB with AHSA1/START domain
VPRVDVWALVSDPYSLPRWWPRAMRVENVDGEPGSEGSQWTAVLETAEGRGVRADYRCTASTKPASYGWEQQLEGTPFERHLRRSAVDLALDEAKNGTAVALTALQDLRGLSRLGSPMMRGGQGKILEQALDGIERALSGEG